MIYMIRRITKEGKVLFRKAGLSESPSLWNRNGKCWTSLGAFKSFLAHQIDGCNWRDKGSHNITKNYPTDTIEVLEIDLDNATITTIDFKTWCESNGV